MSDTLDSLRRLHARYRTDQGWGAGFDDDRLQNLIAVAWRD